MNNIIAAMRLSGARRLTLAFGVCLATTGACSPQPSGLVGPTPLHRVGSIDATYLESTTGSVPVGHHSVSYLGTATSGDLSVAMWAVTENGCTSTSAMVSSGTAAVSASNGGGKGGTNCNGMSHIAFQDFVGTSAALRLPGGAPYVDGARFSTLTSVPACSSYNCLGTVYGQYYGASRPDGPGNWIKYSTINGETVTLAKGFTHIFAVTFTCASTEETSIDAAIKSGTLVAKARVRAPRCIRS